MALSRASVGRVAPGRPKDVPQARAMRVARGMSPASSEAAVSVSECRSTARRDTVSAVPRKRTAPGPLDSVPNPGKDRMTWNCEK